MSEQLRELFELLSERDLCAVRPEGNLYTPEFDVTLSATSSPSIPPRRCWALKINPTIGSVPDWDELTTLIRERGLTYSPTANGLVVMVF